MSTFLLIVCPHFDFKSNLLLKRKIFKYSVSGPWICLENLLTFSVATSVGRIATFRLCCLNLASVVVEHALFAQTPKNSRPAILILVLSALKPTISKGVYFYLSALSCPKSTVQTRKIQCSHPAQNCDFSSVLNPSVSAWTGTLINLACLWSLPGSS